MTAIGSTFTGTPGKDTLQGGAGNDTVDGAGAGTDQLFGNDGDDTLKSGLLYDSTRRLWLADEEGDTLDGGAGNDSLLGGAGNDSLLGSAGNDTLNGGGGRDTLLGGDGVDVINAGQRWDAAKQDWVADNLGDFADGGAGNDSIYGVGGNDTLLGGAGSDRVYGGGGADSLEGGDGDDSVESGQFWDAVAQQWKIDTAGDQLYGGAGNDSLYGGDGNDTLDGGSGTNRLQGGKGDDTYIIRSLDDKIYDSGGTDKGVINVNFFKTNAAVESWSWAPGIEKLPYWIDALTYDVHSLPSELGATRTVKYHFAQNTTASFFTTNDKNGFAPFTADQVTYTRRALDVLSSLLNIRFEETTQASGAYTIVFGNNVQATSGGYANTIYSGDSSVLMVNKFGDAQTPSRDGGDDFLFVLMHELGHSLGLKHPFAHADANGDTGDGPYLPTAEDTRIWTVMSYTGGGLANPLSYSPLDIAALQYIYGPASVANAGDTRITLKENATNLVYDGAGTDIIDGAALGKALTLYMEPGYWGYVGGKADQISSAGQVSINFGSVIENAVGSAYADTMIGNGAANSISGGAGNDTLSGAAGNDTLDGGSGTDLATWTSSLAGHAITRSGSTVTVRDKAGADGTDTMLGIESLRFADLSVDLGIQSLAAAVPAANVQRLVELYVAFFNRTPDADGMTYWIGQMNSGQSLAQIAETFYGVGVQYSSLTGFSATMSSDAFINVVYKNVLGRPEGADAGGLNYWNGELSGGRATRGSLVSSILDAAHGFKGDAQWGWVANLLDNKIAVAKTVSVNWGLSYLDADTAISKGMAIAAAVTPTDTTAALALVGIAPTDMQLG